MVEEQIHVTHDKDGNLFLYRMKPVNDKYVIGIFPTPKGEDALDKQATQALMAYVKTGEIPSGSKTEVIVDTRLRGRLEEIIEAVTGSHVTEEGRNIVPQRYHALWSDDANFMNWYRSVMMDD